MSQSFRVHFVTPGTLQHVIPNVVVRVSDNSYRDEIVNAAWSKLDVEWPRWLPELATKLGYAPLVAFRIDEVPEVVERVRLPVLQVRAAVSR